MKVTFIFPAEVIAGLVNRHTTNLIEYIGAITEEVLIRGGFNVQKFYLLTSKLQSSDCDRIYELLLFPNTTLGKSFSSMLEYNLLSGKYVSVTVKKVHLSGRLDVFDYYVSVRE